MSLSRLIMWYRADAATDVGKLRHELAEAKLKLKSSKLARDGAAGELLEVRYRIEQAIGLPKSLLAQADELAKEIGELIIKVYKLQAQVTVLKRAQKSYLKYAELPATRV